MRLLLAVMVGLAGCWTSSTTPPPATVGTSEPPAAKPAPAPIQRDKPSCDEVGCVLDPEQACCRARRPPPPPQPQTGLPDALDRQMITDGIAQVKPDIQACGANTTVTGVVKVSVKVAPGGMVTNVMVQTTPDAALGACVAAAIQKAQFAPTVNGGAFSFPFVF